MSQSLPKRSINQHLNTSNLCNIIGGVFYLDYSRNRDYTVVNQLREDEGYMALVS